MGKIKVPHTFPVPPMNKGTLNSLKITEPSPKRSVEQGTFSGSLTKILLQYCMSNFFLYRNPTVLLISCCC